MKKKAKKNQEKTRALPKSQVRKEKCGRKESTRNLDDSPAPRIHFRPIGNKEFELPEIKLHVNEDLQLWNSNPRLAGAPGIEDCSQEDLQIFLSMAQGFERLRKSIERLGQLDPIYVWRKNSRHPYLVLEGNSRVAALRALAEKSPDDFAFARCLVLPESFDAQHRVFLLATVHLTKSRVRAWGRALQAKYIHQSLTSCGGEAAPVTATQLADAIGKNKSWVSRLKDAYEFYRDFQAYHNDPEGGEQEDKNLFSILEEISRAPKIGVKVRKPRDKESKKTRDELFDMVRKGVFSDHREVRHLDKFYNDKEIWAHLKKNHPGSAREYAQQVGAENKSISHRLKKFVSLLSENSTKEEGEREEFSDEDVNCCSEITKMILSSYGVTESVFQIQLRQMHEQLSSTSLKDFGCVEKPVWKDFTELVNQLDAAMPGKR